MLVCGMFYTRTEIGERLGWTFQFNGFAVVISSFLQYGVLHTSATAKPKQWQWLYIITTLMTLVVCVAFLLFFLRRFDKLKSSRR